MPSDWQSDNYGQPPPSLDPYQDPSIPEDDPYDATPRGSSSMLVPDMHQLSLDGYDYTQPPGNYHHGFPDQGDQYGDPGQGYAAEPSGAVPHSSGKGKERTTTSGPSKQGGRSSRHSGHSSQKKPPSKASSSKDKGSSSKDKGPSSKDKGPSSKDKGPSSKAVNPGQGPGFQTEQHLPFRPGEETTGPYTPGFEPTHQMPSYHALPPISESGLPPTDYGPGNTWSEGGEFHPAYGSEAEQTLYPEGTGDSYAQFTVGTIPLASSSHNAYNKRAHLHTVHHSSEFTKGKMFSIYWSEPCGAHEPTGMNGSQVTDYSVVGPSQVSTRAVQAAPRNDSSFYQSYRRFIVVKEFEGHCLAVPIYSYRQQGCRKRGCKPEYHGIVHDAKHKPHKLPGEPKLGYDPVRIKMKPNNYLLAESRANYYEPATVKYNCKVMFLGEVVKEDLKTVRKAIKKCLDDG